MQKRRPGRQRPAHKSGGHIPLFDETFRHVELCNSVISHIQRNPPKIFYHSDKRKSMAHRILYIYGPKVTERGGRITAGVLNKQVRPVAGVDTVIVG